MIDKNWDEKVRQWKEALAKRAKENPELRLVVVPKRPTRKPPPRAA